MKFDLKILEGKAIPADLLEIPQPPKKLYIAGSLPSDGTVCLAVVGSRKATAYGKDVVKKLISGLKGYPIAIVSGLAVGIDALSHEAALDAGLTAVAFPGSGISEEVFFPSTSLKLAEKIIKAGGCVISEFEPDLKAAYYTFPMRNRLVAGISKAALIIEAQEKSGTLITARMALDYNKDVLAVPGPISSEYSKGTNKLIRQGATPITCSDDILEALGFKIDAESKQQSLFEDARPEEKLVLKLLTEPLERDELIRKMNLSTSTANSLLSIMEIKGLIKEEMGEIRAVF
ncbi:MAG: Transcriptional regulator, MarR family [Parcubacteria group bacterium GW2011_GWF1_40_6]|uniref:Transcriptional regulator, MarR family n=2 Tax=Candidatus Nomuraibacteriota TaxID=1752729 RepID=A0A0G0QUN1_9BACT|nr:MAG: Transcriptional regulator, MarR family [Candidatus Nomurabacteria bacterium GW2011_GWF2_40_12]KKR69883.1 MAG: Transcriptional regulator, MarR family [Parcubacteria group bacterium GW2011_GWF1_40_6]OGJ09496.1 MAG: DNA protecting protein DprA [Candidatus Nomurabacteria bacterium RIFOXYB1_FULL_39_16]OGJ14971.1 MAG: DNA protecting protein DprA [Candidatus Nomurabacteria bacterium RIFOXYD1_FULL_39_12]